LDPNVNKQLVTSNVAEGNSHLPGLLELLLWLQGMRVRPDGPQLISEMVQRTLGIDCSVLMGANIAEVRFFPTALHH